MKLNFRYFDTNKNLNLSVEMHEHGHKQTRLQLDVPRNVVASLAHKSLDRRSETQHQLAMAHKLPNTKVVFCRTGDNCPPCSEVIATMFKTVNAVGRMNTGDESKVNHLGSMVYSSGLLWSLHVTSNTILERPSLEETVRM
jgi:hypothetical protein